MKKIIFLAVVLVMILFCIVGYANAEFNNKINSIDNNYRIEENEKVVINIEYTEINESINVYKATLEYDETVFEEVQEQDFKTLNNWTQLKYNENTKEFITINKEGSEKAEEVLQITLKVKKDIDTKETNIKIKDIIVSEGKKDINISKKIFIINLMENNNATQNPEQDTEKDEEQDVEQNTEQDVLDKEEQQDNLAYGRLPKTGNNNINIFIILAIIILIINAFRIGIKYKKINKKCFKLFITIFLLTLLMMQLCIKNYAINFDENVKGNLDEDTELNYKDVELLQLHLIHIKTLSNDKIQNGDMNDDGKINITDLALLIQSIEENKYFEEVSNIDYTETLDNIQNPERGFYTPLYIEMKQNNNIAKSPQNNLVHLRVGIGDFSGKVNVEKQDKEFTEDMLNSLNETLENIKKNNANVIIRFAYDNFEGIKDVEPDLEMILTHISQLETLFNKNKDVISYVELGFFGPWGEMHSSSVCTTENVSKAIDKMLEVTPTTMKIGVRTPQYYATWKNVDRSELDKDVSLKGTDSYRIGLYNDGYLGSESDLGTFKNREIEISWLEKQAVHTIYGGEIVSNSASGQALNTTEYISKEGFRTHTTYLNSLWNNTVIDKWKIEIYNGEDSLYKGQTGYIYISNHLGYRFVLKNSKITSKIDENRKLKIKLQVENVGFGNVVNDKKVTIVLEKDGVYHEINTNIDVTTWNSKEIANIDLENILPEEIDKGNWNVYLRISKYGDLKIDNNYNCICFANNNIWNENIGANYIGTIEVLTESYIYL